MHSELLHWSSSKQLVHGAMQLVHGDWPVVLRRAPVLALLVDCIIERTLSLVIAALSCLQQQACPVPTARLVGAFNEFQATCSCDPNQPLLQVCKFTVIIMVITRRSESVQATHGSSDRDKRATEAYNFYNSDVCCMHLRLQANQLVSRCTTAKAWHFQNCADHAWGLPPLKLLP